MVFVRPMEEWDRISLGDGEVCARFLRANEDVYTSPILLRGIVYRHGGFIVVELLGSINTKHFYTA
jgi:hypothetical protein